MVAKIWGFHDTVEPTVDKAVRANAKVWTFTEREFTWLRGLLGRFTVDSAVLTVNRDESGLTSVRIVGADHVSVWLLPRLVAVDVPDCLRSFGEWLEGVLYEHAETAVRKGFRLDGELFDDPKHSRGLR